MRFHGRGKMAVALSAACFLLLLLCGPPLPAQIQLARPPSPNVPTAQLFPGKIAGIFDITASDLDHRVFPNLDSAKAGCGKIIQSVTVEANHRIVATFTFSAPPTNTRNLNTSRQGPSVPPGHLGCLYFFATTNLSGNLSGGLPVGVELTVHYQLNSNAFLPQSRPLLTGSSKPIKLPGGGEDLQLMAEFMNGSLGEDSGITISKNDAVNVNFKLVPMLQHPVPSGISRIEPGTISGAVWWDTKTVATGLHPMSDICGGLHLRAVVYETASGQAFPKAVPVGTTPAWPLTMGSTSPSGSYLGSGSVEACVFKIENLPVHQNMQIVIAPDPAVFLPKGGGNLPHLAGPAGSINIPGGGCGAPPPVPTSVAQLRQANPKIIYCGNGAYDAYFNLKPTVL